MRQAKHAEGPYDKDFFKWTKTQADLLKKGAFEKLDVDNLIEELDALGRSEKRALESYLTVLLLHLLKKKYQPERDGKSWNLSIRNSRHKIQRLLEQNPSLKPYLPQILEDAYFTARLGAISETELDEDIFPEQCPWSLKDILESYA